MQELEEQLRLLTRRIDEHVAPLTAEEIMHSETAPRRSRHPRRRSMALAAVALAGVIAVGVVVVTARRDGSRARVDVSAPTTRGNSNEPGTEPCVLRHAPGDLYSLAQPATIALPNGQTFSIVPGNTITRPGDVTLDTDGSVFPGQAADAAPLLWGAATSGRPFARLDQVSTGKVITLHQTVGRGASRFDCVQRWRVVRIFGPPPRPWSEPTLLRLVGFTPRGALGPDVQFYVDAVPA